MSCCSTVYIEIKNTVFFMKSGITGIIFFEENVCISAVVLCISLRIEIVILAVDYL